MLIPGTDLVVRRMEYVLARFVSHAHYCGLGQGRSGHHCEFIEQPHQNHLTRVKEEELSRMGGEGQRSSALIRKGTTGIKKKKK